MSSLGLNHALGYFVPGFRNSSYRSLPDQGGWLDLESDGRGGDMRHGGPIGSPATGQPSGDQFSLRMNNRERPW